MKDQDKQAQHDKVNDLEEALILLGQEYSVALDRLVQARIQRDEQSVAHWDSIMQTLHRQIVGTKELRDQAFAALYV